MFCPAFPAAPLRISGFRVFLPAERCMQVFFFSCLWYNRMEKNKRPALPDLRAGGAGRIL